MLGSSDFSARLAGTLGLPFAYAHHFGTGYTDVAVRAYRESFRPSAELDRPRLLVTVNAVVAPTAQRATELAAATGLFFLRLRSGMPGTWPSEAETREAAAHYSCSQTAVVQDRLASVLTGSAEQVVAGLADLGDRTGADELMVSTMTHDPADRTSSYQLLADAAGLSQPPT